jgi:probable rRNA maturation factor
MTLEINIYNKQRRLSIDMKALRDLTSRVAAALFAELDRNPPDWLTKSDLKQFVRKGTLSLTLVSNAKIRVMNRDHRGKDYATDVLSFPLIVSDDHEVSIFPGEETLELGDLVISVEKAIEQANEYGHNLERELAFLFAHGLLHVLGFDHVTKAQEKQMFSRQTKILKDAGFTR